MEINNDTQNILQNQLIQNIYTKLAKLDERFTGNFQDNLEEELSQQIQIKRKRNEDSSSSSESQKSKKQKNQQNQTTKLSQQLIQQLMQSELTKHLAKYKKEIEVLQCQNQKLQSQVENLQIQVQSQQQIHQQMNQNSQAQSIQTQQTKKEIIRLLKAEAQQNRKDQMIKIKKLIKELNCWSIQFCQVDKIEQINQQLYQNAEKQKQLMIQQLEQFKLRKKTLEQESSEFSKVDMFSLNKEITKLTSKIKKFNNKYQLLISEVNKYQADTNCRFSKSNQNSSISSQWPLINNQYQILQLIDFGANSEIYKAYDLKNCGYVCIKFHQIQLQWPESVKQTYIKHTMREKIIQKTIAHENIVEQYETLEFDSNSIASVLEFVPGDNLDIYLKKSGGKLQEQEAKLIIKQIFKALQCLQKHNIIHYDLKPQNIMIYKGQIKVTDFGLSKIIDENQQSIQLSSFGFGTL